LLTAALSPRFSLRGFGDPIDQFAEIATDRWIRDLGKGGQQFNRSRVGNELDWNITACSFATRCIHSSFEKGADRNPEDIRDLRKAPGADTVHTFFIFLYLLERDADPLCKGPLRHARGQPMRANGFANFAVGRIRPLLLRVEGSGFCERACLFFHRRELHDLQRNQLSPCNLRAFRLKPFCSFLDKARRVFAGSSRWARRGCARFFGTTCLGGCLCLVISRKNSNPLSSTLALNSATFYQLPPTGPVRSTCHYLT